MNYAYTYGSVQTCITSTSSQFYITVFKYSRNKWVYKECRTENRYVVGINQRVKSKPNFCLQYSFFKNMSNAYEIVKQYIFTIRVSSTKSNLGILRRSCKIFVVDGDMKTMSAKTVKTMKYFAFKAHFLQVGETNLHK